MMFSSIRQQEIYGKLASLYKFGKVSEEDMCGTYMDVYQRYLKRDKRGMIRFEKAVDGAFVLTKLSPKLIKRLRGWNYKTLPIVKARTSFHGANLGVTHGQ
jgi:hypothetical protein